MTVNALHPGVIATNFAMNNGGIVGPLMRMVVTHYATNNDGVVGLLMRLLRLVIISPEQGAQTSIYLATSPEVEGVSGKYFVKRQAVPSSPASRDTATASRLWQVSAAYTSR